MSWQVIRLRRLVTPTGGSWGSEPEDGEVVSPCVRGTDFNYSSLRTNIQRAPLRGYGVSEFKKRCARRGDLIIEKSGGGDQQPVGRVVLHDLDDPIMPTNFAGRLRPLPSVEPRFLCYVMASLYACGRTTAAIKQTTGIQNLDLESWLDNQVHVLPEAGQRAIAGFLDAETARISALVAKKRTLTAFVKERFETAVFAAVTHGLRGEPLKSSGLSWVEQIPQNW